MFRCALLVASLVFDLRSVEAACELELGPIRSVSRVIDGETLALDDGTEVRLMGALAPRAFDTGAEVGHWPPELAAIDALTHLVLGRTVTLGFSGARTDKYGRLVAHVFVDRSDIEDGIDKVWVQGRQLLAGHARAYATAGHRGCITELLGHERVARDGQLGLWRDRGTFQIVAGTVSRAGESRDGSYISFGDEREQDRSVRDRRRAFSVAVKRSDREVLGQFNGNVSALKGQRLEVRGWIEMHAGPSIDISTAGLIASGVIGPSRRAPKLPRYRSQVLAPSGTSADTPPSKPLSVPEETLETRTASPD
jgi:micrococcal nuclease